MRQNYSKEMPDSQEFNESQLSKDYELVLYNDDYNQFHFVIECLMDICKHDSAQAEQCTTIAHFKGSCGVKVGSFEPLREMRSQLANRGLKATVETL